MGRFEIMTLTWGENDWIIDEALQSRELKTLRASVDAIETTRVYPTKAILAKADTGAYVGYALLNLDNFNDTVLAAEISDGYEDSGVLESIMNRADALVWLRKAEIRMGRIAG